MNNLTLSRSKTFPQIDCDYSTGLITIEGRTLPENTLEKFAPLFDWVSDYIKNPQKLTTINFKVEYVNSSSNRVFFKLLKTFESINEGEQKVTVNWYYSPNDEDVFELGEDYMDFVELEFNLIEQNGDE